MPQKFPPVRILVDPAAPEQDRSSWSLELDSAATTVIEFVILVLAFRCRASLVTEQVTRLIPIDPNTPRPTDERIAAVLEQGLDVHRGIVAKSELERMSCAR